MISICTKHPILLICFYCLIIISSCRETCYTISVPEIRQVAFFAYENPETFDDFISNNQDMFDSEFMACLNSNIEKMRELEKNERELCDDAHVSGSDFWHQCHDEVDQNYGNAVMAHKAILNAINGVQPWNQSEIGKTLILWKQLFQEDYLFIIDLLKTITRDIPVECEICD